MATRNRGAYLERTLANIREFIEPGDELVIVDGGSTDVTSEVIGRNRDIVTIYISEPDHGEAHAINKGIFRSRGRYIKLITDDDYYYPDAMRRLIEVMEEHPEADAIQCGGEAWDLRSGEPVFDGLRFLPSEIPASPRAVFTNVMSGLGLILSRETVERIGGVSSNYKAVDADLTCRLIECGCALRYLDIKLFKWHFYPHSNLNDVAKSPHDFALINLRLGNLQTFMQHDPNMFLSLATSDVSSRDRALSYWIWFASLASRSFIWRLAFPLFWIVSRIVSLRRHLRAPPVNIKASRSHEWTGRLR